MFASTLLRGALVSLLALSTFGCAQRVGDIDRTQPNALSKDDFTGSSWYLAQTITEVPTTSWLSFIGETSKMELVRWDIQENLLVAYRAYPQLDGSDPDFPADTNDPDALPYTESPIAAFPIIGHFDIQRSYNTATGEQSNLLVENYSDRPWYERDYMRVNWSTNLVGNFDMIASPTYISGVDYFIPEGVDHPDAMLTERDADDDLVYFDVTGKYLVEPDFYGCLFAYYGWSAEDCTSSEVKVRTSFMRAEETPEYEPIQYDDRMMSKFGYFRTERFGFDPWRGVRQSNRVQLMNRFGIWDRVWQRKSDGELLLDDEGRPTPIPMKSRAPKPIVYHVSASMPEEIVETSQQVAASWDLAFREAVAAATETSPDDVEPMFIVCHNPVSAEDPEACGEEGTEVRTGDIRYNHMYWVDRYTQAGLLGYGPSGADPRTGEIIFGAAYVYGTEVDSYAQYATDLVRLLQGDLTEDDIQTADFIKEEVRARLSADVSRPKARTNGALSGLKKPESSEGFLPRAKRAKVAKMRRQGLEGDRSGRQAARMQQLDDSNLSALLIDDEIARARTRGAHSAASLASTPEVASQHSVKEWASARKMRDHRDRLIDAAQHNMYLSAFADDAIVGLAKELQGEDPEQVRAVIRRAVYRAVMEHEVGHTIGLRHNFQGSYDSLNYFDDYWALRGESIIKDPSLDELYTMSYPTQAQIDGRMQDFAYSSIMDYGMRFNSDVQGIGKYDHAAILFGYTFGTTDTREGPEPGFVHTWSEPGDARTVLAAYQDPPSLAYDTMLEQNHYTTIAGQFPELGALQRRDTVRYKELVEQREQDPEQAPVEVHYMFCSDEWVGAVLSCQVFDAGADPFEIARHTIQTYKDYYTLQHWSRDRAFFWSEDVLFSSYGRYFSALTHLYQQWVFAYFFGVEDLTLDNYYLFAATSAFNLLAEVMMTPAIGNYEYSSADGVMRLTDYSTEPLEDADLFIGYDQGKDIYTSYQYDAGYYYYDRVEYVGHFWDYLGALFALTDSESYRLGVDTAADEIAYSIPWYMFFEYELTDIINAIFTRDMSLVGPRVLADGTIVKRPVSLLVATDEAGEEVSFDPLTGEVVSDEPEGFAIELDTSYTQDLYGVMYGMAFFTSNFSLNFPDQWRIFRVGSGENFEAGEGFSVESFEDPHSGVVYGALVSDDPEVQPSGAALMIRRANKYKRRAERARDDDAYYDADYYMVEATERLNLLRSLYDLFGATYY